MGNNAPAISRYITVKVTGRATKERTRGSLHLSQSEAGRAPEYVSETIRSGDQCVLPVTGGFMLMSGAKIVQSPAQIISSVIFLL